MKRILALILACTMLFTTSVCAFAAGDEAGGSKSPTAEEIIKEYEKKLKELNKKINDLEKAIKASQSTNNKPAKNVNVTVTKYEQPDVYAKNNAVNYGGNVIAQGGHVEINGGKSNVTFVITGANGGLITQANSLAASLGGSLVNCINTSSPGVRFSTAKVNFYVAGVQNGDNIAVYQIQGKKWVQLTTAEIRKDHVVVNMSQHGTLAFIRVPVLATVTY